MISTSVGLIKYVLGGGKPRMGGREAGSMSSVREASGSLPLVSYSERQYWTRVRINVQTVLSLSTAGRSPPAAHGKNELYSVGGVGWL